MFERLVDRAGRWRKAARGALARVGGSCARPGEKAAKAADGNRAAAQRSEVMQDPLNSEVMQRWANSPLKAPE